MTVSLGTAWLFYLPLPEISHHAAHDQRFHRPIIREGTANYRRMLTGVDTPWRYWSAGRSLRGLRESHANPVFLDPGNSAFVDRGVVGHHQAKVRGYEGRIFNVDGGAPARDFSYNAAHDRTARRNEGRFVVLGPG